MQEINEVLDTCLRELSREYDIEEVDKIPHLEKVPKTRVWRILIPALVAGKVEDVEAYIRFPKDFPYSMPCVIVSDDRFKYLPHISQKSHKLCLYEDGVVYDEENVYGLIRDHIYKTRHWIEFYYGRDNSDEYANEIRDYWNQTYNGEKDVDDYWVLLGDIPSKTCELKGVAYSKKNLKDGDTFFMCVVAEDESQPAYVSIKNKYKTYDLSSLYLASLTIPTAPPYNMTGQDVVEFIADKSDREIFKKFINRHGSGYILFSIGISYVLGGVYIHNLKANRNGFRPGILSPFILLTQFENKNKKQERLLLSVYSDIRITERTSGEKMKEQNILIAGLGSIGSNLCYYLNGYNNAKFVFADRDVLSVDNIGRHLLGYEYISQLKSYACAHYLQQYRPDREVKAVINNLQELNIDQINSASSVFVCTGDVMSERWLLDGMKEGVIKSPAFVLWLEPYGISGIMLYVNPEDKEHLNTLITGANDCFLNYCLIKRDEYESGDKLIHRDAGCNGSYAHYSANDVTMFLSAMFPRIDDLITNPSESTCYRWVGNIKIAAEKGIELVSSSDLSKHMVQELKL